VVLQTLAAPPAIDVTWDTAPRVEPGTPFGSAG
jgi:hypothetical protein